MRGRVRARGRVRVRGRLAASFTWRTISSLTLPLAHTRTLTLPLTKAHLAHDLVLLLPQLLHELLLLLEDLGLGLGSGLGLGLRLG